ncbi:GTPase Era [Telmatospirillum siberiense]|uniref:GTPase Era n=1 Tax=Telmatospirillum siberiense TaxID=382514 RepID=A0A2N3PYQ1_9PROT|nr:GTPase Era [Telmatospirillum siberiense]PKU25540.1 GTPase Era [Telmatospirillum siberiense]
MSENSTRCGFIAVVGAPNAGKSTLVNQLVGTKVSIVSPKVQTTRSRVLGIAMVEASNAQIIFIDTPGIFAPKRRFERAMVQAAWSGAADADQIALVIDAERGVDDNSQSIIDRLKEAGRRAVLVLNKIDLVKREKLLALTAGLDAAGLFDKVFMVSARTGDGTGDLLAYFAAGLPEGPWHFPEDQVSDMPMRLLAAEITREQVFHQLHQELPYAATVETEQWTEKDDGSVRIDQIVYVQRDSQKGIVLGKAGRQIKSIGEKARVELEEILERRVHLFLHVKVRENWLDDRQHYRDLGLDFDA